MSAGADALRLVSPSRIPRGAGHRRSVTSEGARRSHLTGYGSHATVLYVRVTINGELYEIPGEMTLTALVRHLDLAEGPVAIERNREIVSRAVHDQVMVRDGDTIEIVHFVGGG